MQHWQCSLCGLRVQRANLSPCPKGSGRLLQVHDWQDAFELAKDEGVLTWEYSSRDEFLRLQDDITNAGWVVEKVEEVRRSGGLFSRQKIVVATLRLQGQDATDAAGERRTEQWSSPDLLRPREEETEPPPNGNGHGNGNGHSYEFENGRSETRRTESLLQAEGDDQYQSYPEIDDSAVFSAE